MCTLLEYWDSKLVIKVTYPKIQNKGRTSNNMCAPLFWRKKMNWKIKGAHQIKSDEDLASKASKENKINIKSKSFTQSSFFGVNPFHSKLVKIETESARTLFEIRPLIGTLGCAL